MTFNCRLKALFMPKNEQGLKKSGFQTQGLKRSIH